jgi:hypothetical protein
MFADGFNQPLFRTAPGEIAIDIGDGSDQKIG